MTIADSEDIEDETDIKNMGKDIERAQRLDKT